MPIKKTVLGFYCCLSNYHRVSGLKQQKHIMLQLCTSQIQKDLTVLRSRCQYSAFLPEASIPRFQRWPTVLGSWPPPSTFKAKKMKPSPFCPDISSVLSLLPPSSSLKDLCAYIRPIWIIHDIFLF